MRRIHSATVPVAALALVLALIPRRDGAARAFRTTPPRSAFPVRRRARARCGSPPSPPHDAGRDRYPLREKANDGGDGEDETRNLLQQVKDAGTAGAIAYALWEAAFWGLSVPVCLVGYRQVTGGWPDLTDGEDLKKLGAEAFAFVNLARFAVPLRIGLALGSVPWVEENVLRRFGGDGAAATGATEVAANRDSGEGEFAGAAGQGTTESSASKGTHYTEVAYSYGLQPTGGKREAQCLTAGQAQTASSYLDSLSVGDVRRGEEGTAPGYANAPLSRPATRLMSMEATTEDRKKQLAAGIAMDMEKGSRAAVNRAINSPPPT